MKKILIIASFLVLFTFCKDEEIETCGCKDPKTELQWLSELIKKAETDTTGVYAGSIYLEEYGNKHVFYITMMMRPVDHVLNHWFDCEGNPIIFKASNKLPIPKFNHLTRCAIKQPKHILIDSGVCCLKS